MKATGIVRRVDNLGRVVLPIELRRTFDINIKDDVEIYIDGDSVVLKKYKESCIFCNNVDDLQPFKTKFICPDCLKDLKK